MKMRLGWTTIQAPLAPAHGNQAVKSRLFAAAGLLICLALPSCGSGGGGQGNNVQTFHVKLTSTSFPTIVVGNSEQFTAATVDNTTGNPVSVNGVTFSWTSSNTAVATINSTSGVALGLSVGTTTITVVGTNSDNNGVGMDFTTLTVVNPLTMNAGPLSMGALNIPYPTTGLGGGGVSPLTWSLLNGTTLPAGLTMSSSGKISGTPTTAGVSPNFTVQVTDSETPPVSKQTTYSITTLDPADPCSIVTNANPQMLNGSYAFVLQGFQAATATGTPLAMAGSFAADGSGTITDGELDVNVAAGPQHLTVDSGVYAVDSSGQGCVQLNYTGGTSNVFHFALSQLLNAGNIGTYGRIIEFDGYQGSQGGSATNLASGVLLLQDPAEFATSDLDARFAFGEDGFDMAGKHVAIGGSFSFNSTNGNLTNLAEDFDDGGTISTVTGATGVASSTATTGTTGRETVTLTLPGPTTLHLASYIVNQNELLLVSTDTLSATVPISSGRAIVTGNSYTASSFSGNYIFRAEGLDYEGDGAACAANGPCDLTDAGILNADAATGALGGTLYQVQAGASQTSTITDTYSVSSSTGRIQLSSATGGNLPVLYVASPVTSGTDATESFAAFIVGSGPTQNSANGDPTALFGFIEAQPSGPYSLNSPPAYILATEDSLEITDNCVAGNGSFSAGSITFDRDVSGIGGLLTGPATFSVTVNAGGTLSPGPGTPNNVVGVTNSTSASPGKAFLINTTNPVTAIRLFEP
jgi:hypothetical protein